MRSSIRQAGIGQVLLARRGDAQQVNVIVDNDASWSAPESSKAYCAGVATHVLAAFVTKHKTVGLLRPKNAPIYGDFFTRIENLGIIRKSLFDEFSEQFKLPH